MSRDAATKGVRLAPGTRPEIKYGEIEAEFRNRRASEQARRGSEARARVSRGHFSTSPAKHPDPATGDPDYSEVESAYLVAIDAFQRESGRRFPTHAEQFAIARRVLATYAA